MSTGVGNRETPTPKLTYRRRALGIGVCFCPVMFLVVSMVVGQVWPQQNAWGVGLSVVALLVAGFNLYLSAFRPALYFWRRGSMDGFRKISGLPLLGTLFAVAGGIIGFADWRAAALGLVALALDLTGLPWFLIATWRDQSFWDA